MAHENLSSNDPEATKRMRSMLGPQQVDHQIRQAIQFCWMSLPPERQNVEEVEKEVRRIFDRALRDLNDDWQSFGFGDGPTAGSVST